MKIKGLTSINTSAFANCMINEFDAPKLNSITVDKNVTFIIGRKNF